MRQRPYSPRTRYLFALHSLVLPLLLLWQIPRAHSAAAQTCPNAHTVQFGENLYRISLQYGVTMQEIAQLNGLPNFDQISVGQVLCLPASAQTFTESNGFAMSQQPIWESSLAHKTTSLAWGDVDNDGDLDLAVGNTNYSGTNPQEPEFEDSFVGQKNYLYLNRNGVLDPTPVWSGEPDSTRSLAWGDFNGDGFLDLAVGNYNDYNKVYLNDAGQLSLSPDWISANKEWTTSIAWGDLNEDGAFDLLVKNEFSPETVIYYNLQSTAAVESVPPLFSPGEQLTDITNIDEQTLALLNNDDRQAVGFINQDAQLDKIITIFGSGTYYFDGAPFDTNIDTAISLELSIEYPSAVAPGDANGDGHLDLAIGDYWGEVKLFRFFETAQSPELLWESVEQGGVDALAWGDVDGDGDLDLAVGGDNHPVRLYLNESNLHPRSMPLIEINPSDPTSLSTYLTFWGDSNGDGFYDFLKSSYDTPPQIMQNGYGENLNSPWQSTTGIGQAGIGYDFRDAAWGDIDNDHDLDLIIGYYFAPNRLYRGIGNGALEPDLSWNNADTEATTAVAWGDLDGDGDLDLAVGNRSLGSIPKSFGLPPSLGKDQVFLNNDGSLSSLPVWQSSDTESTLDINWWDYDADGDLDLVATTDQQPNSDRLYVNEGGMLREQAVFVPHQTRWDETPLLDVNGDGRSDFLKEGTLYLHNHVPAHPQFANQPALNISLLQPAAIAPATTAAQGSYDKDGLVSFPYQISGPIQQKFDVFGFFSLDGGETWQTAVPTEDTNRQSLAPGQTEYLYSWDVFKSGVFGTSDSVRFRLQVRPSILPQAGSIPGLYQRPFAQTETLPFRIRGQQVQVLQNNAPLPGAVVYRLPGAQTSVATLQTDRFNQPFTTNSSGFLAGRAIIEENDQLVALWPVPITDTLGIPFTDTRRLPFTDSYTLFYTSGKPTEAGLAFTPVDQVGVQQLTVSADNKLLLFHLNVSLEWDGRSDPLFMLELEESFKQASALLYDVTNGQVALGQINLFHNKAFWGQADVVIYADNGLRPSAAIGGLVDQPQSETVYNPGSNRYDKVVPDAYVPGQIRMGTVWDPYGERTADLGEDWTRALAHELAHYLLFLPDNYLGFKPVNDDPSSNDILQLINCPNSFMTTTTDPAYSELLTQDGWVGDCAATLADKTTGRTDWETVTTFYPMLSAGELLNGPSNLPLAVTYLIPWAYEGAKIPLPSRNFDLRDAGSESADRLRLSNAQGYLFRINDPLDATDDVLLLLGAPTGGGDRLKVRGALPDDRLCVFGNNSGRPYAGCIEALSPEDASLNISQVNGGETTDFDWQPQITVQSVTSRTFTISVDQPLKIGESLQAQLFPLHYGSVPCNAPVATMISNGRNHTLTLTTRLPAYEIAVHIWADQKNGREALTTFRLNPPWDAPAPAGTTAANTADCDLTEADLAALYPVDDLTYVPLGGPNDRPVGGPNDRPVGGPNDRPVGGPNNVPIGGPNDRPVGGPNDRPVGGPNDRPVGGTSTSFNAPILSADAQVVVYSAAGFFEPNGVTSLQVLDTPPAIDTHPWLLPVGSSYRLVLENNDPNRFISFNYLQRDVPDGYEHTLAVYFLPEGSSAWQPIIETEQFVENFVVAPLQTGNGTYALMATITMPALQPGWNLLAYPLPDCRSVEQGLASISDHVDGLYLAEGDTQAPNSIEIAVQTLEPRRVYWVHNRSNTAVIPRFAPPERLPDGSLPSCLAVNESRDNSLEPTFSFWLVGITAVALLFLLLLLIRRRRQT